MFDESFEYCFNSYYESVGPRQPRGKRGLLTRPSGDQVRAYRAHVDVALADFCANGDVPQAAETLIELGINHEQQHQELLLTDILSLFASEPLKPAYPARKPRRRRGGSRAARLRLLRRRYFRHRPRRRGLRL